MRLELSQYWEIEAFAQFGSDLDKATLQQLERGKRLIEVLKQDQYSPLRISLQIAIIYAALNGFMDEVPLEKVREFEKELFSILNLQFSEVSDEIESKKVLSDPIKEKLGNAIGECKKLFVS